jgi:hypothetical protein
MSMEDMILGLATAARINAGNAKQLIDEHRGLLNLDENFQAITVSTPEMGVVGGTGILGGAAGAAASGAVDPWDDAIQTRVELGTAFERFIAGQPFAQTPGLRTAVRRIGPLAQTQFALQPRAQGATGGYNEFSDFLSSPGGFLRGPGLTDRLNLLTRALTRYSPSNPVTVFPGDFPLESALYKQFESPENAFQAYQLPYLQGAGGVGRDLLRSAFEAFERRFMHDNPEASAADVASQFGFNWPLPPPPPTQTQPPGWVPGDPTTVELGFS